MPLSLDKCVAISTIGIQITLTGVKDNLGAKSLKKLVRAVLYVQKILRLNNWPQLFKERITLSSGQNVLTGVHFVRWIAIYPLDRVIRSLNNRGLFSRSRMVFEIAKEILTSEICY